MRENHLFPYESIFIFAVDRNQVSVPLSAVVTSVIHAQRVVIDVVLIIPPFEPSIRCEVAACICSKAKSHHFCLIKTCWRNLEFASTYLNPCCWEEVLESLLKAHKYQVSV